MWESRRRPTSGKGGQRAQAAHIQMMMSHPELRRGGDESLGEAGFPAKHEEELPEGKERKEGRTAGTQWDKHFHASLVPFFALLPFGQCASSSAEGHRQRFAFPASP